MKTCVIRSLLMYHLLNTMFKKLFQLKKRTTYDEIYGNSSSVIYSVQLSIGEQDGPMIKTLGAILASRVYLWKPHGKRREPTLLISSCTTSKCKRHPIRSQFQSFDYHGVSDLNNQYQRSLQMHLEARQRSDVYF